MRWPFFPPSLPCLPFLPRPRRTNADDVTRQRYGDELGRLQLAEDKLQEAGKLGRRGVPDAVVRDLKASRASPLPLVLVVLLMLARGGTDAE